MAYQSLYRKYRPSTFDDMVGQNHITRTLRNAISADQLAHAYLFVGPRGTGKTTTARILAKALLCEVGAPTPNPDGSCAACQDIAQANHQDVIELDAASRTGVENVREEIISRVHYAPIRGTYKVYIIDEVHMLSTGAFNAMLKTLEEPPDHVIFVMCTTHPQKVPQTIRSRCQQFDFHPISIEDISGRLGYIANAEGITIDQAALPLIAKYADGGMRDAITALEQLISYAGDEIVVDDVEGMLGEVDAQSLATLATFIAQRDPLASLQWIQSQVEVGADLVEITRSLQEYVRDMYIISFVGVGGGLIDRAHAEIEALSQVSVQFMGSDHIARLLDLLDDAMTTMRRSTNPRLVLEMALIRAARPEKDMTLEALAQRIEALEAGGVTAGTVAGVAPQVQNVTTRGQSAVQDLGSPDPDSKERVGASVLSVSGGQPNLSPNESTGSNETGAVVSSDVPQIDAKNAPVSSKPSADAPPKEVSKTKPASDDRRAEQLWRIALNHIRDVHPSRYPLFAGTTASYDQDGTTILISYSPDQGFRMKQAAGRDNLGLLSEALREAAGTDVSVTLTAGEESVHAHAPVVAVDKPLPDTPMHEEPDTKTAQKPDAFASEESQRSELDAAEETADETYEATPVVAATPPNKTSPAPTGYAVDAELEGVLSALGATIVESENAATPAQEPETNFETMTLDMQGDGIG
jgi:DNA polymerase-3 subunit gamma/tau